jgi:hypothetical protein
LLLAAVLAGGVVAQSAPARIVQASDGTLYLLKDGARYAIVADFIEDDELNALADGGEIGGSGLLNALAGTSSTAAPVNAVAGGGVPAADDSAQTPQSEAAPSAPVAQAPPEAAVQPAAEPGVTGVSKSRASGPGQVTAVPPATGAPPAAEAPKFVSVQGNGPGKMAYVTVQAPPGASCSLGILTAPTRAAPTPLGQQTVDASGKVTWSFVIDPATRSGSGLVTLTCGRDTITSPIQFGLSK